MFAINIILWVYIISNVVNSGQRKPSYITFKIAHNIKQHKIKIAHKIAKIAHIIYQDNKHKLTTATNMRRNIFFNLNKIYEYVLLTCCYDIFVIFTNTILSVYSKNEKEKQTDCEI